MCRSLYVAADDTSYELKCLPNGKYLKAVRSGVPNLQKAYDVIEKSLKSKYQPVLFDIRDSIGLWIDENFYYIKGLSLSDNDCLDVQLFGTDTIVHFPLFEENVTYTAKEPMLQALDCDAFRTSVFGGPTNIFKGAYFTVTALKQNYEHVLEVDAVLPFRVKGDCVGVKEGYIEVQDTKTNEVRVYSGNCMELNRIMASLPTGINVFLGDDCDFYISGLPLAGEAQTLKIVDWKIEQRGRLVLTCNTLANSLPFQVTFSILNHAIRVDMPYGYSFTLSLTKCNNLEEKV